MLMQEAAKDAKRKITSLKILVQNKDEALADKEQALRQLQQQLQATTARPDASATANAQLRSEEASSAHLQAALKVGTLLPSCTPLPATAGSVQHSLGA